MTKTLFGLPFWVGDPIQCAQDFCKEIRSRKTGITVLPTSMNDIYWVDQDKTFRKVLKSFDHRVPDGMPLVWLLKRKGSRKARRIYGPDLMLNVCDVGVEYGLTHFLYGGDVALLGDLERRLVKDYPSIKIVGTYAPPFRPLHKEEEAMVLRELKSLKPDVVWVGIGSPKQVYFIDEWKKKFPTASYFAVGASFDFNAGRKAQAPAWMQQLGLEWLFRLITEPRRLFRRYVIQMPVMLRLWVEEWAKR